MPRASTTNDSEETPKRAPRKRAVRRVVTKSEAPVRRTRQSRVTASSRQIEETVPVSARRAPTKLSEEISNKKSNKNKFIIAAAFFLLMLGTGVFVGMSDDGQIDVNAQIEKSKSQKPLANEAVGGENNEVTVPVQNTAPPAAISGLRPRAADATPAAEAPAVVASTTDENASTTEAASEQATPSEDSVDSDTESTEAEPVAQ